LQRQIAGRPGVGVAKTGQKINICSPGADAVDGGERRVRILGGKLAQRGKRQVAAFNSAGNLLQRADFGGGQSKPRQARRARAQDGRRIERIESRDEPPPNGIGARGRKLLGHNDCGKAGESIGPPAQRWPSRFGHQRDEPRIGISKRDKSSVEIGFGMNMGLCHSAR
jgi:hypothetical protein